MKTIYYIWISLLKRIAYPVDIIVGWVNSIVVIVLLNTLWQTVYGSNISINNYDLNELVTYIVIIRLMQQFFDINIEASLGTKLQTGDISILLVKPMWVPITFLLEAIAGLIYNFFVLVLPIFLIISIWIKGIQFPSTIGSWFFFIISASLGWGLLFTLQFMLGLLGFFNIRINSIYTFRVGILSLAGGLVIPLSFYPDWAIPIIFNLPIIAIFYRPVSIFVGVKDTNQSVIIHTLNSLGINGSLDYIIEQFLWLIAVLLIAFFLWKRMQKVLMVNGG